MVIVFSTLGALAAFFAVHWVWWRVALPKYQTRSLLLLALGVFVLTAVLLFSFEIFRATDRLAEAVSWLYFVSFYWVGAFTYVITYSAMEGDSPTLSLALTLARSQDGGMSRSKLDEFFRKRPFVDARLVAMVNDGLLVPDADGCYRLAQESCRPFDLILWWRRRILGFKEFGG